MRWKLMLIASLLAAFISVGLSLSLLTAGQRFHLFDRPIYIQAGILLVTLAAIVAASIFVYRHTARRRSLQAILTSILTALLVALILGLGNFERLLNLRY